MLSQLLRRRATWALVVVFPIVVLPAVAGAAIFVTIDGIVGEGVNTNFVGALVAHSMSIGFTTPIDPATGQATKVVLAPVTITKRIDKSTPVLMQGGGGGTVFKNIVITSTVLNGNTQAQDVVHKVTLAEARITDWRLVQASGDEPIEQITFQPTTLAISYTIKKADGSTGTPVTGQIKP